MAPAASPLVPGTSDPPLRERDLSQAEMYAACLGLAILAITVLEVLFKVFSPGGVQRFSRDASYRSFTLRLDVILAGIFCAVFCLTPVLTSAIHFLRRRWRSAYTYGALAGICAILWVFILHFGRWQFGAWDFNILIDTGWRQVLGQRPYVDFVTPNPPGFNLGIKYAYELFGVNWDANLYFCAIFACLTFLWMYWLMVRLEMGRLPSMVTAFAIECAAMLTLCFWWYNNSVLILAAVFFLSCLACAIKAPSSLVDASYFLSLMLLSLMKPNIAGVTIVGGLFLLFMVTDRKVRLILLTLAAAVAAVGVLLIHHVSIPALLVSYLSAAKGRGSITAHLSYLQMSPSDRHAALLWISLLSIPLLGLVPKMVRLALNREWKWIAIGLFFPLALLVAIYGLSTNGEVRDAECTLLLAAGAVLTFGLRWNGPFLRRFYIAIVCASIVGNLYYGAMRVRVFGIGPRVFFEWQDNQSRIDSGFLKNMRVGSTMIEVQRELGAALKANPGPYFLGPRLEFDYAVFGLVSPEHLPVYWQPGTSFPASQEEALIELWQSQRFRTLIFMKSNFAYGPNASGMDYTFYSKKFLDAIDREYARDDSSPFITIYHRRATELAQPTQRSSPEIR